MERRSLILERRSLKKIRAQLVEHRTGIAEVTGSNPSEALIFFRLLLSNCLNWKIYCDDHSSLSKWIMLVWKVRKKKTLPVTTEVRII